MEGAWVPLTAEWFATMADVHRLRGALPPGGESGDTADGGAATPEGSARRLARMVGRDTDPGSLAPWRHLADYLAERQVQALLDAAYQTTSRTPLPPEAPLVGAGIGRFLVRALAERLGRPYRDFNELVPVPESQAGPEPADCAPAVSLALLGKGLPLGERASG
jgi:probable H4MPT-linked C1 transfer pathway protein